MRPFDFYILAREWNEGRRTIYKHKQNREFWTEKNQSEHGKT